MYGGDIKFRLNLRSQRGCGGRDKAEFVAALMFLTSRAHNLHGLAKDSSSRHRFLRIAGDATVRENLRVLLCNFSRVSTKLTNLIEIR